VKRLTMLGAPASGKGTQGERLAVWLGVPHVAAGDLLRDSIEVGDPFGIEKILDRGDLVPDEITRKLLFPELGDGFVLDGYPRSLEQAVHLDRYLESVGRPLDAAVELLVPDETLAARVALRARSEDRSDDAPEVFVHRLAEYHQVAAELRRHYGDRLIEVEGTGSEDEVFDRLVGTLGQPARA
jgi:adenylate kinase